MNMTVQTGWMNESLQAELLYNSKAVLVVDDAKSIRKLVSLILSKAGYDVIEAVNGIDALNKLKKTRVGMVITDLRMPEMDGLELIKRLRRKDAYKATPIVMLTTEFREAKKQECKMAGVNEWIEKPFIFRQLLSVVNSLHN